MKRRIIYSTILALAVFAMSGAFGCKKTNSSIPKWNECTLSSNWHGSNASRRMMNILSPHMPDATFDQRVNFMKTRGCNTAHVIICNKSDGEYGGYSIYGNGISWKINENFTKIMTSRIKKLRKDGFGIVLWLVTDDCGNWNSTLVSNFDRYCSDIKSLGWFDMSSTVVLGLEMDEYWSAAQAANAMQCLRNHYSGKTGVHMTSGRYDWAGIADIMFYQTAPGKSASQITAETKKVKSATKKPVNFFELSRSENRDLCNAAISGGAFGVGNW